MDERAAISGLVFEGDAPGWTGKIPTHRYSFPLQDTEVRPGKSLRQSGGETIGKVVDSSSENGMVDIKKPGKTAALHPAAVFAHEHIASAEQAASLFRIGENVTANGIECEGPYQAARDLLLRLPPRLAGSPIQAAGETTLDAATRVAGVMVSGVLPVQGPPGTGKSHTGARMICRFVADGKKVGITANSHKVIRNLLDKVMEAASEMELPLRCVQKPESDSTEQSSASLPIAKNNDELLNALGIGDCQVAGATSFCGRRPTRWRRSTSSSSTRRRRCPSPTYLRYRRRQKRLVLLGDPQQLDQPTQGHTSGRRWRVCA